MATAAQEISGAEPTTLRQLNWQTAALVRHPWVVLNRKNVRDHLIEMYKGSHIECPNLVHILNQMQREIQSMIEQGTAGEEATREVLCNAGLPYVPPFPTPPISPEGKWSRAVNGDEARNGPDNYQSGGFQAINASRDARQFETAKDMMDLRNMKRPDPEPAQPPVETDTVLPSIEDSSQDMASKPSKRDRKRLLPHELSNKNSQMDSPAQRFCQNIGHWLRSRLPTHMTANYAAVEELAGGLLPLLHDGHGTVSSLERDALTRSNKPFRAEEYRSLRGRILIGFALIYEHNLRGAYLNGRGLLHPACCPVVRKTFRSVNLGRSQAQMIANGTNVNSASDAFRALVEAGRIPSEEMLSNGATAGPDGRMPALEQRFPAKERHRLYGLLLHWYHELQLPPTLVFAIDLELYADVDLDVDADHQATMHHATATHQTSKTGLSKEPEKEEAEVAGDLTSCVDTDTPQTHTNKRQRRE